MIIYTYIRENILVPRNLKNRKDKLRQNVIKLLSQEVIEDDLDIDESFFDIPEELVKVKEIHGDVTLLESRGYIPSWLEKVKIYGYFDCSNTNLKSLKGSPKWIGGSFFCNKNELQSLEDMPKYIGGNFHCKNNKYLKYLEIPKDVKIMKYVNNEIY